MRRRGDEPDAHTGVGAYLLGGLPRDERERVERHAAGCDACRTAIAQLRPVADLLERSAPATPPPGDLEARTLEAVRREAELAGVGGAARRPASRGRRTLVRRLGLAGAAVLALAAAFAAGSLNVLGGHESGPAGLAHNHDHGGRNGDKLAIQLASSGGGYPRGHSEMRATKQGGTVAFHSDHLRALPKGEYYELWLIGPGGKRISGGRFVPDAKGTSYVDLPVSVDPSAYGVVAITREPDDANRAPTLPDVVRSDWSSRCAAGRPGGPQPGCR